MTNSGYDCYCDDYRRILNRQYKFCCYFCQGFYEKTNVMRNAGILPGGLTFICDALKGFVACYMGRVIFDYIFEQTGADLAKGIVGAYLCGVACMLGHVFPFFFGFKGGKGAATSVGIFIVCCPIAIIVAICVFVLTVVVSKYVSLGSILGAAVVVVLASIFTDATAPLYPQIILSASMGVIVVLKHKDNIKRLISGTESKIKFGGK